MNEDDLALRNLTYARFVKLGRFGQAQRAGQPHRRVVAGRAVDTPLQVTDRPLAHSRRLGQLLLGQPGLIAQLPQ